MIHYCAHCARTLAPGEGVIVAVRRPLTERLTALYRWLVERIAADGYAPSLHEIADHFGYRSIATVHEHLVSLQRKGWIRRAYNESRSIEILPAPADELTPDEALDVCGPSWSEMTGRPLVGDEPTSEAA